MAESIASDIAARTSCDDVDAIRDVVSVHIKLPSDFEGIYAEDFTGPLHSATLTTWRDLLLQCRSDLHRGGSLVQSAAAEAFGRHYQQQ